MIQITVLTDGGMGFFVDRTSAAIYALSQDFRRMKGECTDLQERHKAAKKRVDIAEAMDVTKRLVAMRVAMEANQKERNVLANPRQTGLSR